MGMIVTLDYGDMNSASYAAKKAAKHCDNFVSEIERKVTNKIDSLERGSTGNTLQANYFARAKIRELNEKKTKYENFASKVDHAVTAAKETDKKVASYIKTESRDFRKANNMEVNVVVEWFTWLSTTILNSTEFGRWLNTLFRDIGNWIDTKKRDFKRWYHLEGGKYIIKTVVAVIGTVLAVVFLVCVAWPALLTAIGSIAAYGLTAATLWTLVTAAAGVVTAVVSIADSATKVFANTTAALMFEDDPGWAARYGSYSSFADYMRKNNFNNGFLNKLSYITANAVDFISTVATVVNLFDFAKQGFNLVQKMRANGKVSMFQKMHFRNKSGKVTWSSLKYGFKALLHNLSYIKSQFAATNISRLHDFYKNDVISAYGFFEKIKKSINLATDFMDKGAWKIIADKLKEKTLIPDYLSQIKDAYDAAKKNHENMDEYTNLVNAH